MQNALRKVEMIDAANAQLAANASLPKTYQRTNAYTQFLGESAPMKRIRKIIEQIAPTDASVLITGESGTGKELAARAIHLTSIRQQKPLVIVNCAAIPDTLVESELFGHEKGAFTGALSSKKGKFEFADGSTLFLDEIGDLSPTVQAKLLRVLQDGSFQRVGGNAALQSDVRLIAATNKNLAEAIQNGEFREDLFYRINVVLIEMPPLRDRREDISPLIHYYLDYYNRIYQKSLSEICPKLIEWMMSY
ncbi:sigma-54-dependent Fis family transcriptional regulator, partial [candidate division KSB1 bacterium]|nr:sigma-54-dependent Fis family transcriptional regulator [candidate division KSB1 bacterium]